MKYISGLFQFDSLVTAEPVTRREPGDTRIHGNSQTDSNRVSSTQQSLTE